MPYLITTFDKPGHGHVRDAARAEHFAYLTANAERLLAGGGFPDESDGHVFGGALLLDVDSRAAAQDFIDNDPFAIAGLFSEVRLTPIRLAFFDRQRV